MFRVLVDDNFHYMDEDERYTLGEFESWTDAVMAAKRLVDTFLSDNHQAGMSPDALYEQYTSFGDNPFIVPQPEGLEFSAWDYARARCHEICNAELDG